MVVPSSSPGVRGRLSGEVSRDGGFVVVVVSVVVAAVVAAVVVVAVVVVFIALFFLPSRLSSALFPRMFSSRF